MSEDPVTDVMWMVRGAWVTMSIRAGCRLGLFDHLAEPRSAAWLAEATASDQGALTRLLRALTEIGLVEARDDGTYLDTPRGSTLTEAHPASLRSLALMQSWLPNVATWNHLDDAVRSGSGVYERVNGRGSAGSTSAPTPSRRSSSTGPWRAGPTGRSLRSSPGSTSRRWRPVVDVGGGRGAMLAGVLRAWPRLTGVIADRPDVAAEADAAFAEAGLSDRAHGVGSDFFDAVPSGADVYFLSNVLHDWDDDDCRRILRTIRSAMDAESRLVVVERLLAVPGRSATDARDLAFVDLHMLVMFGARERTKAEYDALLEDAGFRPGELIGPGMSWNLIETRPAVATE